MDEDAGLLPSFESDLSFCIQQEGYDNVLRAIAIWLACDGYNDAARDLQTFRDRHRIVLRRRK